MHVHLLQYDIAWEDKAANHQTVRRLLSKAAPNRGDLVVLPEMFDTGFSMRTEITAQDPEVSVAFLSSIASQFGVDVTASIPVPLDAPDRDGRCCTNRAYVMGPDGAPRGYADKVHPFSFGREAERFVGGDSVLVASGVGGVRGGVRGGGGGGDSSALGCALAPIVCYDLRFPECFRAAADVGCEVFAVIANWPDQRASHWRTLCIARAIENQAYVLGLNRCGCDPRLRYAGGSLVVDPLGEIVAEAGDQEAVVQAELDLDALRAWRERFPALRDRTGRVIRADCADPAGP